VIKNGEAGRIGIKKQLRDFNFLKYFGNQPLLFVFILPEKIGIGKKYNFF